MAIAPRSFLYALSPDTGVATVTLNRPERLNALTFEIYAELRDTFHALDSVRSSRTTRPAFGDSRG